jgi:hypothetical protein
MIFNAIGCRDGPRQFAVGGQGPAHKLVHSQTRGITTSSSQYTRRPIIERSIIRSFHRCQLQTVTRRFGRAPLGLPGFTDRWITTSAPRISRRPVPGGGSLHSANYLQLQIAGRHLTLDLSIAILKRRNYITKEIKPLWVNDANGSGTDGVTPSVTEGAESAVSADPPRQPDAAPLRQRPQATPLQRGHESLHLDVPGFPEALSRTLERRRRSVARETAQDEATRAEIMAASEDIETQFPQGKMKRTRWDDQEWARIYATQFLSLGAVIRCLKLFGVQKVGPLSMREILLRCNNGKHLDISMLQGHLQALEEAEIGHESSVFCRLVSKLSKDGNEAVLSDMATCDMHPGEYGDANLQEALLAQCDEMREPVQFERIWAALLHALPAEDQQKRRLNLLLRRALSRNDPSEVNSVVQRMRDSRVYVERRSLQWMYQEILPERSLAGLPPIPQIHRLISLWTTFIDYGCIIPIRSWGDILRTLLIQGDLDGHEDLFLKLIDWCTKPFRAQPERTILELDILLTAQCLEEILLYGFYHGRFSSEPAHQLSRNQIPKERVATLASHPTFRGLRLLLRLRSLGCNVDIREIQAILRRRIWMICYQGYLLPSGVRVQRVQNGAEYDYHRAAELLIGEKDRLYRSMKRRHRKPHGPAHFAEGTDCAARR